MLPALTRRLRGLTRAVLLVVFNQLDRVDPRTVQRKYSYVGGASSSCGQLPKEGYVQEARALDLATPRHMGIFQPKLAALVAGGSGI